MQFETRRPQLLKNAQLQLRNIAWSEDAHDFEDDLFQANGHWRDAPKDWDDPEPGLRQQDFMHVLDTDVKQVVFMRQACAQWRQYSQECGAKIWGKGVRRAAVMKSRRRSTAGLLRAPSPVAGRPARR